MNKDRRRWVYRRSDSSFILHPSSLKRHAKINKNSKPKPIARRHIRAGFDSHPDLSDLNASGDINPFKKDFI